MKFDQNAVLNFCGNKTMELTDGFARAASLTDGFARAASLTDGFARAAEL